MVANVNGRAYRRMNGRKTRPLYCVMPEAGATKSREKTEQTELTNN